MANVSGREVINFFKSADLELAELVMEFAGKEVEARVETRNKISANLKKARAARKPAGSTPPASGSSEPAHAPSHATTPLAEARGRAHRMAAPAAAGSIGGERVPAPAHTAAATSVESDSIPS